MRDAATCISLLSLWRTLQDDERSYDSRRHRARASRCDERTSSPSAAPVALLDVQTRRATRARSVHVRRTAPVVSESQLMSDATITHFRGHEIRMVLCLSTNGMTEQFCVYDDLGVIFITHSLHSAKRMIADRCQREVRNARKYVSQDRLDDEHVAHVV